MAEEQQKPITFEEHMQALRDAGFDEVDIAELEGLENGTYTGDVLRVETPDPDA